MVGGGRHGGHAEDVVPGEVDLNPLAVVDREDPVADRLVDVDEARGIGGDERRPQQEAVATGGVVDPLADGDRNQHPAVDTGGGRRGGGAGGRRGGGAGRRSPAAAGGQQQEAGCQAPHDASMDTKA
jgi:hypothetical protein